LPRKRRINVLVLSVLYPLKLRAKPSPRLWGGERLKTFVPDFECVQSDEPLGEAWLIYAGNKIENGLYKGRTLQEMATDLGEVLLGSSSTSRYGKQVPLLAKFLDAGDSLSIQVHPDDAYARTNEAATGDLGKTEAWYVLDAEPGAQIIWGFAEDVAAETVRQAVQEGRLEPHLNFLEVSAGDVIFNPTGTVHALGAGIFIFEIQQSSDLTYRLYDYNRRGADGKLRELHLEKALEIATLSKGQNAKVIPQMLSETVTCLIQSDFFVMERWTITETLRNRTDPRSLEFITVLEGSVSITAGGETLTLVQAESAVLPAQLGEYQLAGNGALMRCYLP